MALAVLLARRHLLAATLLAAAASTALSGAVFDDTLHGWALQRGIIDGNRFVVIERDDLEGDAAKAKRVYSIDLDKAPSSKDMAGKPLAKKLVIDLLSIGNAHGLVESLPAGTPFRFPYLTPESIQVLDRKHVVVVNDNNYPARGGRGPNVKDATEWLWLELASPL